MEKIEKSEQEQVFALVLQSLFVVLIICLACPDIFSQETKKVKFSAAITEVDANLGKHTKRLIDNVVFEHEGAKMYCDSAYFYSDRNSLDAFSDVYVNQGDTLHLYGEFLHYEGNTKQAYIQHNVKLINKETTLTTSELDYNIADGIGYYTKHADILNEENHLESIVGYYYTQGDIFDFRDSVVVTNPDYVIHSERLEYNTESDICYFMEPTEIFSDSSYIYCERGWYNLVTDISQLNQNAMVKNTRQTVKGDSLYYEKETGYGSGVNNVEILDEDQDIILRGNRGVYYEKIEYARMTEMAEFIQITSEDSLYMHADTLMTELDTAGNKLIKAYYNVRFFKKDLQGTCDSMIYNTGDSTIRLYNNPVLWSDEQQLTADYIELHTENSKPKTMYLYNSSFIIRQIDTVLFDQIKGKNMVCHFRDNELFRIDVSGNGQTVYYPLDEGGIIGANKTICSDLVIYLKEGKVVKLSLRSSPEATLFPLEKTSAEELKLEGFKWIMERRPLTREDIFN